MANVQNLKPWRAGQSGNENGRPRLPEGLKKTRGLTSQEVRHLIAKFGRMSRGALEVAAARLDASALEVTIASIWLGCLKGDIAKLDFFLQRTIGKLEDGEQTGELSESMAGIPTSMLVRLARLTDLEWKNLVSAGVT